MDSSASDRARWRTALAVSLPLLMAAAAAPVRAIPRLDLKPYPAPAAGESRWVIQVPGVLRPSPDPAISSDPADWRVELIVGRELEVDCNRHLLQGRITPESVPGWGYTVYRVSGGERALSTLMACPPDQPPRRAFVPLAGEPTLVRYNASLPIVVYAPKDLEVRWRLWKGETDARQALKL
ncbi:MAG: ecotin family protein [Synechococcaceae cyanobacterium]